MRDLVPGRSTSASQTTASQTAASTAKPFSCYPLLLCIFVCNHWCLSGLASPHPKSFFTLVATLFTMLFATQNTELREGLARGPGHVRVPHVRKQVGARGRTCARLGDTQNADPIRGTTAMPWTWLSPLLRLLACLYNRSFTDSPLTADQSPVL